jgi:hypothetical protein
MLRLTGGQGSPDAPALATGIQSERGSEDYAKTRTGASGIRQDGSETWEPVEHVSPLRD